MRIEKLEIEGFGKLIDRTVALGEGLNVCYAPNETGKSTLAAFLKYLLYGFRSRGGKRGALTARQKYAPWTGGEPRGAMTLSTGRGRVNLSRRGSGAPLLHDALTGAALPLGGEPGESFYGVSLDTFESTAFFGQNELGALKMEEVEERLKNLVTGGDESISFEAAQKALRAGVNRLDNGRGGGRLPRLRAELSGLSCQLESADAAQQALGAMRERVQTASAELTSARREAERLSRAREERGRELDRELSGRLAQAQKAREATQEQLAAARARLRGRSREELDELRGALERLAAYRELGAQEPAEPVGRPGRFLWIPGLALLLGALALGATVALGWLSLPLWAAAALAAVGLGLLIPGLCAAGRTGRERREAARERERRAAILREAASLDWRLASELGAGQDYAAQLKALQADWEILQQAAVFPEQAVLSPEANRLRDARYGELSRALSAAQETVHRLEPQVSREEATVSERSASLEDPAAIRERMAALQEELTRAEKLLAAYRLSLSALDEAHREMAHLFSPILTEKAGEILSRLTPGTDRRVTVESDGTVRVTERGVTRPLEAYSAGTADAAYIALRLGLVEMLYGGERPPLIFDDTFANLDEERAGAMLRLLAQWGKDEQILYFTCRDPEPLLRGAEYSRLSL